MVRMRAEEFRKLLEADPEYRARRRTREAERAKLAAERTARLAPFRADLAAAGFAETYDRLTGIPISDDRVFAIALEHLARDGYDDFTRAEIARTFVVRGAWPYWERLVALFRSAQGEQERDALGAALSTCAKSAHVDQMMSLVRDASLGPSRIFFLRPINRLGRTRGKSFVMEYLDDPELGVEANAIRRGLSRNQG